MKKLILLAAFAALPAFAAQTVLLKTSAGEMTLELDEDKAPATTANFLAYVNDGFYNGTVFHRVIAGFMIQGGGFDGKLEKRATRAPIANESYNGLKNERGTIAMARTSDPHSATAQFFINHADNAFLNPGGGDAHGYAVFGKVVAGMDVVDKIAALPTGGKGPFAQDVPEPLVVIESATVLSSADTSSEAVTIAEKFVNDYIGRKYTSIENWLSASTENFRKVYKEREKALELSEALLNEEIKKSNLSQSDKNLLKKYPGIEYDPFLGAILLNVSSEHSNFKVKSWDEKTGIIILEDAVKLEHNYGNEIVKLKLVKSKGKWLIDGAGGVNME